MECATLYYDKKHYFPMHLHPDLYTFSYILGGSANLICQGGTFRLKENDLVIIPPYMAHQSLVDDFFYYKVIRVPKSHSFTDVYNGRLGLTIVHNCFSYKDHFDVWYDSIRSNILVPSTENNDLENIPEVFKRFLAPNKPYSTNAGVVLRKALTHFEENYHRPILVEELSDLTCMSESHFQRLFKSNIGIAPMRYLLNLRIEKAKEYIKTKDSFSEVAYETGFYDQSHFNKYFKTSVGMIPKRYADLIKE
ncbi:AraC family transcriptional regulator [Aureisphaera galaxeae]|uniref:helix-turn-helix domain-containing protein n=1 Tax=Aureisphaera galaxeae TaxID=1538023 RepID=UPI002350D076|nr:AraC family transcriptional regulator [Aureisphaera galaxeae]MDC8004152.1 AraC family transcriptional regulator [Aureisphaera galaxeae]